MTRREIPVTTLRELVTYDPENGVCHWLPRRPDHFRGGEIRTPEWQANLFNSTLAGKVAGYTGADGYIRLGIFKSSYLAHRVAFALMTGAWPTDEIDHINGRHGDNSWANLRAVDRQENAKNLRIRRTSRSGVKGVDWHDHNQKWRARITLARKTMTIGSFDSFEAACAARVEAQSRLGFHPNHGLPPS